VLILDTVLFLRGESTSLSISSPVRYSLIYIHAPFSLVLALYERNYKVFLLWIPILLPFGVGLDLLVRNTRGPDSFNLQCDLRRIPAESPFLAYVYWFPFTSKAMIYANTLFVFHICTGPHLSLATGYCMQ